MENLRINLMREIDKMDRRTAEDYLLMLKSVSSAQGDVG
jgi:hypothetical protein